MTLQNKIHNPELVSAATSSIGGFVFWQRWLFGVSIITALFGIDFAFLNGTFLFGALNAPINVIFWGDAVLPIGVPEFQAWIYGVTGAVMAGWGIMMAFMAYTPFKQQEKWAWNALFVSLVSWYVMDTFISIQHQVYFNAVFNTIFLIMFALPLIFTRKYFQ